MVKVSSSQYLRVIFCLRGIHHGSNTGEGSDHLRPGRDRQSRALLLSTNYPILSNSEYNDTPFIQPRSLEVRYATELFRARLAGRQADPARQGRQLRADRGDLLGHPQAARTVGWALNALSGAQADEVPWQRVINSAGRISISRADLSAEIQRARLEEEGVEFDARGYIDWKRFGWAGLEWGEVEALWAT